jgi:hypothetical protein
MRRDRLQVLADHLRTIPEARKRRFNMDVWGKFIDGFIKVGTPVKLEKYCDTAACALGEATTIPEFRRAGLKSVVNEWERFDGRVLIHITPMYKGRTATHAAQDFFETDYQTAYALFHPNAYFDTGGICIENLSTDDVADRIEILISCDELTFGMIRNAGLL